MILYQSATVTITGRYYFSVKSNSTTDVILAEINVAPTTWSATNIPPAHEVIFNATNKEFIFKHATLSTITLSEGKYSIGLSISVGSEVIELVFLLYVVKEYRVEEHVFEGQALSGFLNEESRVLNDCILSIFVCEKDDNAFYRRYTYYNNVNQPIDAIAQMPKKNISIDDVDGVKHQEYSVELQPTAPIEHIFERFIELQNQPFVDDSTSEDTLFAYLRLVDKNNEPLCEGIIDTQDGRFQFQYETEVLDVVRINDAGQSSNLTYRVSNAITLQIYSPSTLLKAIPIVDNVKDKITYTPYSDGNGFADYLYNEFITLPFLIAQKSNGAKIVDIIERFAKYINRNSVLAKTGILQSTSESIEVYGYQQLCSITLSLSTVPPNDTLITINDILDTEIFPLYFVLSDTYGEGEQDNGERRSFNVERTRGLRGTDGRFPRRDSERDYSFLLLKNAEEILNALTLATACLPAFQIITESAGAGTHKRYKLRTLLIRAMNRGETKNNITNIIEIDKAQKTLNVVQKGEVDGQSDIIYQFDQVSAGRISYREIDGFGQEYKEGINDGFFLKNVIEMRNQNEVRAVGATNIDINDELLIASKRKTTFQFFPINKITDNQISLPVLGGRNVPIFYAVILDRYIRFTSYYAEALLLYQALRLSLLRREIIENVQLNNLTDADVKLLNEATVLKTNLLHDGNDMRYYKVIDADIDLVGRSAVLNLERVKSPFEKYNFNTNPSKKVAIVYDTALIRWFGMLPRRVVTPFNASAYPSLPTNLPFNNGFTADEKKEFTLVDYKTGNGLFGDAYEGVNVKWIGFSNTAKLSLIRFMNNKRELLKNQVSVPSTSDLYAQLSSSERNDVYKRNARYIVEVKDEEGGRLAGFDIAKGCLVVRKKPANRSGVGVRLLKFVENGSLPIVVTTTTNINYRLYVESIFTYRGRFLLFDFRLLDSNPALNFSRVEFHENFIRISILNNFVRYLMFNEQFKAGEEIHFEIDIDHTYGSVNNYKIKIRLNGVDYDETDLTSTAPQNLSPLNTAIGLSTIACTESDNSFACVKLFRAFERQGSSWARICDLSFNNVGASNADEPFAALFSNNQTQFIEYDTPTQSYFPVSIGTDLISIQPETAFNLSQL